MTEAELDARFAEMADDADYQAEAIALAQEFARSDWQTFQLSVSVPISDDAG